MAVSSEDFRDVLRHFPSGVTIVTIQANGQRHGLTVSAFASISPSPPLIMVAIDHRHSAETFLQMPGASFAINILGADQRALSNRFAWEKDEDRFLEGNWETAATGAPVLADALAWLDCTIHACYEAGTHSIYVGAVQASKVPRADELPLVYWNRSYRQLALTDDV
jgi:flavin reductase ActVB